MFRSRKLLDLADGAHCMNCLAQDGTVVAAHSNHLDHGRGHAHKSHDCYIAFLCYRCHAFLDHGSKNDPTGTYQATKEDKREMFRRAMDKTWLYLWMTDRVKVS